MVLVQDYLLLTRADALKQPCALPLETTRYI